MQEVAYCIRRLITLLIGRSCHLNTCVLPLPAGDKKLLPDCFAQS
ncbi:unnamed protein product [Amoebophrya sp. A120]|nr:unnamed protein product [Amoebophrya sp. A120]|eukprot:GSA120T00024774001.1